MFRSTNFSDVQEMMGLGNRFERVINSLTAAKVSRYEITGGGEPFLNHNLQFIVSKLRAKMPSAQIKVYTNGSIYRRLDGIDELNISVAHWDSGIDNSFFRFQSARDIESILRFFSAERSYKLRLSIPMLKGGIDGPEKAREMIARTSRYVDSYVFRPLFPFTHDRALYDGEFIIHDPLVEVDGGSCSHADIVLWMPNNKAYTDWDLTQELWHGLP
jgi:hypothetical protein